MQLLTLFLLLLILQLLAVRLLLECDLTPFTIEQVEDGMGALQKEDDFVIKFESLLLDC